MDKQHILEEINRTAKENSGKALGREKFAKETGIRPSDWLGKYWAKWGDACIEAGYSPNKMSEPYDEEELVERMVSVIRELRRFPTGPDLRLKSFQSKDFPGRTILARLGNRGERAQKIIDYCRGKPEYSDIVDICTPVTRTATKESEVLPKEPLVDYGYVYLMKSGRFYKIGSSNSPGRRNYELGIKLPEKLKLVHEIKTDDPVGIEAYWHNRFKDKRKKGEWFDLSLADISAFTRRKFM